MKQVAETLYKIRGCVVVGPATCFGSNGSPGVVVTVVAMDIQDHALEALRNIYPTDSPFDMTNAVVFVLGHDDIRTVVTEYPDVYVALDTIGSEVARIDRAIAGRPLLVARALGVVTCGWAAPVDDGDTPPSRHPQRRRVRLATITTTDFVTSSALEFQDTPNQPIFDDGSGSGSLRDALLEATRAIVNYQNDMAAHTPDV